MTIEDENALHSRELQSFNTYLDQHAGKRKVPTLLHDSFSMPQQSPRPARKGILRHPPDSWIPGGQQGRDHHLLSIRRRLFLLLTEPESSTLSTIFYVILMAAIFAVNIIMVIQTMEAFQFTPEDCVTCGGDTRYFFDVDDFVIINRTEPGKDMPPPFECVCPPEPMPYLRKMLRALMAFFVTEWTLRLVFFEAEDPGETIFRRVIQWLGYLTSITTLMDALATFPFYLESLPNTFVSLRLLRLFRIFQLIRLGKYNVLFLSLTNVMAKSLNYLRLLVLILAFGSVLFGSLIYWMEKGTWQYYEETQQYLFIRVGADGITEEPSPFRSIPQACWWFMVTATTVGYGDYYPTSSAGKWIACFAMMMGVLVIAFPVSVFSDLWQQELKKVQGFEFLHDDDNSVDNGPGDSNTSPSQKPGRQDGNPEGPENETTALLRQHQLASSPYTSSHETVIIKKDDLREMVGCLRRIKEEERNLKRIIRKYQLDLDDFDGS